MKNPYSVLNIDVYADQQTIKSAFRTLAKQYHPDKNNGSKEAEQRFIEITEAYNILSDPDAKKEIDSILRSNGDAYYSAEVDYNNTYNQKYTAQDIEALIKYFHQQVAPYKSQAITALLGGLFWLAFGVGLTWVSYLMSKYTLGIYVVFRGLIFVGALQSIRAFWAYLKINKAINKFEEEMWAKI